MKTLKRLAALPLTALVTLASHAQHTPVPPNEALGGANTEQNQQQRRDAQQREAAVSAPAVRSDLPKIEAYPGLPHESPCFRIEHFALNVPETLPATTQTRGASALPQDPFAFAHEWLEHYAGQCVGKEGIDMLTKGLQQAILARGYVTTRVLLQPQDLTTGSLTFALVPGIVRNIGYADPSIWGTWKTAFPARSGDLLNVRDLDQGLEQMKRVPNQDVTMEIRPTDVPGESDVVLTVQHTKPWTFVASVDNSGTDATGKWQGNISLGLNNPLGLNDILSLGANQDLSFGNKSLGTHGFNGSYSVPFGYWTATLSGNTNTYYQDIAGVNQTFVSSGNSQTAALRLARVLSRSQNDVLGGYVQLSKRFGDSFIDDTTIPTQARNNTFLELGMTDRHYFGASQFDGTLAYRQGIGGFGATADPYPDGPTPDDGGVLGAACLDSIPGGRYGSVVVLVVLLVLLLVLSAVVVIVGVRIIARDVATQSGTRAATHRGAHEAASRAAHRIACGCAGPAAQCAANHGAGALLLARRHGAAGAAAHCSADHGARAAANRVANRRARDSARRAAHGIVHIARCGGQRRHRHRSGNSRRSCNLLQH